MCRAVRFNYEGRQFENHFTQYNSRLPVLLKSGHCSLVTWGRRRNEAGNFPYGEGVRLATIQAGIWDALHPKPVKIAVPEFMETDVMDNKHWFQVTKGQYIQGMLVKQGKQLRVYMVELDCNAEDTFFKQWVKIISSPF